MLLRETGDEISLTRLRECWRYYNDVGVLLLLVVVLLLLLFSGVTVLWRHGYVTLHGNKYSHGYCMAKLWTDAYRLLSYAAARVLVCRCRCLNSHHAALTLVTFGHFWSRMMKADKKKE